MAKTEEVVRVVYPHYLREREVVFDDNGLLLVGGWPSAEARYALVSFKARDFSNFPDETHYLYVVADKHDDLAALVEKAEFDRLFALSSDELFAALRDYTKEQPLGTSEGQLEAEYLIDRKGDVQGKTTDATLPAGTIIRVSRKRYKLKEDTSASQLPKVEKLPTAQTYLVKGVCTNADCTQYGESVVWTSRKHWGDDYARKLGCPHCNTFSLEARPKGWKPAEVPEAPQD